MTDEWLKENDPYYRDKSRNKRKKLEYHYETDRQEQTRVICIGEIPFSSLWKSELGKVAEKGVDVKMYYNAWDES